MTIDDLSDRLTFAFPTVDVDATGLDPFDDADRAALVRLSLPEAATSAADTDPEHELQAQTADAVLTLRDGLAKLILLDVADVWPTVLRLRSEGFDDERIHELLFEIAIDRLLSPALTGDGPSEPRAFVRALHALPEDVHDLDDPIDDLEWLVDDWMDGDDDAEDAIAAVLRSTIHDDLLAVVGDGFVPIGELVDRFAPDLRLDRETVEDILGRYLRYWTSDTFVSPSGIVATESTVVDGTRFRHVVTAAEAATERLEVGLDFALILDRIDLGDVVGFGELRHSYRDEVDGDEDTGGDAVRVVEGPAGWMAGATEGDTIAITRRGREYSVEVVHDDVDSAAVVDAFVRARTTLTERIPIDVYWLYNSVAIEERGFGPDLGRPLSSLLTDAGWESRDDELAPAGFDWEAERRERIEKGRLSVMARAGVEGPGLVEPIEALVAELFGEGVTFDSSAIVAPIPDDRVRAISTLLARPGVPGSVFTIGLGPDPSDGSLESLLDVATSLIDRAERSDVTGPARLGLLAAAKLDRVDVMSDLLGPAHVNGADDPALRAIAGDLELDRGRIDAARRHYDRGDIDPPRTVGEVLRSAGDAFVAGRNDPCPCGSGRKFKRCHGAPGGPPMTEVDRCRLLIARLENHDCRQMRFGIHRWLRLAGLVVDDEWLADDAEIHRPLLETLSWFEDGGLAGFLESRGSLLSDADRSLAESWIGAPLVVASNDGDGLVLMDGRRVAETTELGGLRASVPPFGVVGRLVPIDGEPTVIRGIWIGNDMEDKAAVLTSHAGDAKALAEAIGSFRPG